MSTTAQVDEAQKKIVQEQQSDQNQKEEQQDALNDNQESQDEDKDDKEDKDKVIPSELLNDDTDESNRMEKLAMEIQPYFSNNTLPKSLYFQNGILPIVYEALNQVEKIRPKDPIEFFAVYLLDKNKPEIFIKPKITTTLQDS